MDFLDIKCNKNVLGLGHNRIQPYQKNSAKHYQQGWQTKHLFRNEQMKKEKEYADIILETHLILSKNQTLVYL